MTQIPNPELATQLGVVGYLLIVLVVSGVSTALWVARRVVAAMDRIADAVTPMGVKLEVIEEKIDRAVALGEEHVRIARMWERTEAPGREVRQASADK